ncbi:MAG: DUF4252 domain-containing protein [Acidobacteria bacterium]|nr:DUF4252 domain-containing protein [Acidobacteriota bacterium]MBV9475471.1 DUF4252 domain-containing protein [Acidobacteriota bacterium]
MKTGLLVLVFTIAAAFPAAAQQINLDFPGLADKADEVVDVTLDATMLRMAAKFLSNDDADQRNVRDMIHNLEGVYVRSYDFGSDGDYDPRASADRVRSQLGANWKPLVNVRSRTKENVSIFADMRGDKVNGLVIISAEPHEFTVVNIVGPVDIDRLASLEGEFGIPRFSAREKSHD